MAVALAEAGASLALAARDEAALQDSVSACRAVGAKAEYFLCDVTSEESVLALEKDVKAKLGPAQILINNAGMNLRKSTLEFTLEEWNRVLATNLTSAFLLCRSFVPHMKGSGYGRVINITSMMSHISLPGRGAYSATKAGLLGFTKALALELAPEGITVTGISPGPFATEMNIPLMQNPEINQKFLDSIPIGQWGKVEDIGQLALYLCSEHARFITGSDILIDGGWCAR
jgi:NAD(P)-dependent dehydrogenase (short-subunit alcohol dehydrogenase family)